MHIRLHGNDLSSSRCKRLLNSNKSFNKVIEIEKNDWCVRCTRSHIIGFTLKTATQFMVNDNDK